MLYTVKVRLLKPFLGDRRGEKMSTPKAFLEASGGELCHRMEHVNWALRNAIDSIPLPHVHHSSLHLRETYRKPTLSIYARRYRQGGKDRVDHFRCIRTGAVLTFDLATTSVHPEFKDQGDFQIPTTKEAEEIIRYIGSHLGLSPWGSIYGFGRFEVLKLTNKTEINAKK